ncbi:MAG: hypothetical protein PHD97_12310, partial [Bacteroidales bacterium]|nr:hypothetical protein [Bacteroidales bacterium]
MRYFFILIIFAFFTNTANTAITFLARSVNSSPNSSITINKPTGTTVNDILIAQITYRPGAGDIYGFTSPAGWTRIRQIGSFNVQYQTEIFYKIAGGAEPASYTFTGSNPLDIVGAILAYRGVDVTNPIISSSGRFTPCECGDGTLHPTPCMCTPVDSSMIVALFGLDDCSTCNLNDVNFTPPAGMTERYDIGEVGTSQKGEAGYDAILPTKGCVNKTAISFESVTFGTSFIMLLRPSGAPVGTQTLYLGDDWDLITSDSLYLYHPVVRTNDLLIAQIAVHSSTTATLAIPSGWTQIRVDNNSTSVRSWLCYKVAGASEPEKYAFKTSAGVNPMGILMAYRGIDPAAPIEANDGGLTGTSATPTAPSVTTITDSAIVVNFYGIRLSVAFSPSSGCNERYDFVDGNQLKTLMASDFIKTPAGATGTIISTASASGNWLGQSLALKRLTAPVPTAISCPACLANISASGNAVCSGSTATLTASGATTYTWNTTQTGSSITVNPTITSTYTVTGSSGASCGNTATAVVTVNTKPSVSANSPTICNGESTVLTGTGATTYTWNPGGTGTSITVTPTVTTTYTVTGTASGCTNTTTATVTVNTKPNVSANSPTICNGASTILNGSGATTYTWNPGGTGTSITVTPTITTTYSLTGTTSGCTNTSTATVSVNSKPSVSANSPTICNGASIVLTGSGATTYTWAPGGAGTSITVSPTSTTTYSVTGTDGVSCTNVATATVTVNAKPNVSANSPTICNGASIVLTGSGATTYTWAPGGAGTSITVSPTSTTTYSVTGTDGVSCTNVATATVTVNAKPNVSANSPTICNGASIVLTGSGATTYTWAPGGAGTSITVSPTSTTTYSVIGTDGVSCTNVATATVTVNAKPN